MSEPVLFVIVLAVTAGLVNVWAKWKAGEYSRPTPTKKDTK